MADLIFLIDQDTKEPLKVEPVSFAEIGIKEREDLEKWVIDYPDLLGEDLLVITSEFDKFDKTHRRLDILALDSNLSSDLKGTLVVIELKLDANRSLADQQAIRYAAFCSTMKMEDIVELLAKRIEVDPEDASAKICEFLGVDELPNLGNHPRIILAAGSLDDQELTSTVLWLRTFRVDISCIELTPYRLPKTSQIILVPRIIIPLPEAIDYVISVEQKDASEVRSITGSFFDRGNFGSPELENRLRATLSRPGNLTPRLVHLLEILLSEDKEWNREDIKQKLFIEKKVGSDIGQTGRYLSNLSQFLTKKSNSHLRQVIEFTSDGGGQIKNDYRIVPEYRELITFLIRERNEGKDKLADGP
jgi:hypothetical protein